MGAIDYIIGFGYAATSAIAQRTQAILAQVVGIGGFADDEDENEGEVAQQQELFSALGLLARPLAPSKINGLNYRANVVCLKTSDGLVPIGWKDLRLNRAFPDGLKEGTVAIASYGGGFHSLDLTPAVSGSQKATIHTIYCPFEFDSSGVPAKAHTIVVAPEGISIVHSDGFAVVLDETNGITLRGGGSTWLSVKDGKVEIVADSIQLRGNVALGADTSSAVPLLPGAATQPTPSVFFSPV